MRNGLEKAKEAFVIDWLHFLTNDKFQMMIAVIFISGFIYWLGALEKNAFEKILMTTIGAGFLGDGLNELTNIRREDND